MTCTLSATVQALRHPIVVIGYGNPLRSDDGVGPRIADEIASWRVPNVRSLTCHQLTPELAEALSEAEVAIFVDASHPADAKGVNVIPLQIPSAETSRTSTPTLGHTSDPISLLTLTQSVYDHAPQAWWVQVPAAAFGMGEHLSAIAEQGIADALEDIDTLIRSHSHPHPIART